MSLPFLGSSLIFMIVYIWSRRNPTMPVAIWGAVALLVVQNELYAHTHSTHAYIH